MLVRNTLIFAKDFMKKRLKKSRSERVKPYTTDGIVDNSLIKGPSFAHTKWAFAYVHFKNFRLKKGGLRH